MVRNDERPLRMLVIHSKSSSGFHIALVPGDLSEEQVDAALKEVGVDGEQVYELGGWKTTAQNVAVARVPFPEAN